MNQLTYVTQSRCPHTNDITHVVCVNGENRSIIERNRERMLVLQYKRVQIYASKNIRYGRIRRACPASRHSAGVHHPLNTTIKLPDNVSITKESKYHAQNTIGRPSR